MRLIPTLALLLLSACCLPPASLNGEVHEQIAPGMAAPAAVDTLSRLNFSCRPHYAIDKSKRKYIACIDAVEDWTGGRFCNCVPGVTLYLTPDGNTVTKAITAPSCWGYAME